MIRRVIRSSPCVPGSEVEASYDAANRPIGRQITPVAGLGGVLAETFLPDALGRIERSTHGGITTEWTYDALSRIVSETQGSKTVSYAYDDQGNVTSLEYPSGMSIGRTHTAQNRILEVGDGGASLFDPWVSYEERIPGLLEGRNLGMMTGSMSYDAAQRPTSMRYSQPDGTTVFGEELSWTTRDQLARRQRIDLNGWSDAFTYDAFDRLVGMERQAPDGEASPTSPAGSPSSYAFTYDAVHNLLSREERKLCSADRTEMPSDESGRHRPSSIGDQQLTWNANGELLAKGDLRFTYDFLGRLVKIEQEANGQQTELVSYTYDALNRRVGQHFAERTIRTVWDGWQPIEDYEIPAGASGDGELLRRRVYGRGIDEVIRLEQRLSVDNPDFDIYVPFYDSSGNVAMLTTEDGDVVERYEYSPYGQRIAWADTVPPAIEQLRLANGAVVLELSEAVDRAVVEQAVQDGLLGLHNTTQNQAVELTVEFPVSKGKQAHRRIVLRPNQASQPNEGDGVELTVASAAVVDYFDHSATEGLQQTFQWTTGSGIIVDQAAPRVATVCTDEQGHLEIQLSETTDPSTAATQIQVDGATVAWTLSQDGYTLVSTSTLEPGSHDLTLGTGPLDLSGQGLETSYGTTFELPSESLAMTVDGGDGLGSTGSIVSNPLGFQGLHHDAVGGLVYVRNRYYDPEMGRFIQPDPLGFVDGPNVYQFAVGNPVNGRDPLGLAGGSDYVDDKLRGWNVEGALNKMRQRKADALRSRIARLRMDIAIRSWLNNEVAPEERVYALAQWSHEIGMSLQDRAALQRRYFGMLGTCQTSMEKFACAGASEMAGTGQVLDRTLELVLAIGAGAEGFAGLADDGFRAVSRFRNVPRVVGDGGFRPPSPGVTVRNVGNYWIKEVDPDARSMFRWHGERSLKYQSEGLTKLGDMAPSHIFKNGKLITRDAGKYTPGNFWKTWLKGSIRLRTPVNDIRPRNVGANGIIFDPALDPIVRPLYWTVIIGGAGGAGYGLYELLEGDE